MYGDLKKWLDGLRAGVDWNVTFLALGSGNRRFGKGGKARLSEFASWVRRVGKGGRARFTEVTVALQKEGYGDLWFVLMTSDEAKEACRQMVP